MREVSCISNSGQIKDFSTVSNSAKIHLKEMGITEDFWKDIFTRNFKFCP